MSILHNSIRQPQAETTSLLHRGSKPPPELAMSFDEMNTLERLLKEHPEMLGMSKKDRAEFLFGRRSDWLREIDALAKKKAKSIANLEALREKEVVIQNMLEFCRSPLVIEKPDGPSFRRLRRAVAEGATIDLKPEPNSTVPAGDFEKEVFRFAEVFVVEHDWASAFASSDMTESDIRLPCDVCAFEFKFSGSAVIALATQLETTVYICVVVEHDGKWIVPDFAVPMDNYGSGRGLIDLYNTVGAQIRAVCIALDAEVARSETVRATHVGQRGNSYQAPRPYHIVSLARRGARPLSSGGCESGRHVRFHFRRGHWRHLETYKTWIRWMLVGDPDLGFVDKHYRL